ncbi:uncharacterized protein LOC129596682 [Paramacrobiotus metropolitanus]|uniref:uncharacterized protein LOC129596682 n=1 Tax=Paramacrobiotus metropolitanus TaxID=2943436 RepID=UPI0024459728|nr:uncharacterized protein LOC129596682 [Paramacrobiotus metropolitanus]
MNGLTVTVYLLIIHETFGIQKEVLLESTCNKTLMLHCPTFSHMEHRAARLKFNSLPLESCAVVLQMPTNCRTRSSIYLNFPACHLRTSQTIQVFERTHGNRKLIKRLNGNFATTSKWNLHSVAHIVSAIHRSPSLEIVLHNKPHLQSFIKYETVLIDMTIISQDAFDRGIMHCPSLKGYVPKRLCERDQTRITCPHIYRHQLGSDGIEQCLPCGNSTELGGVHGQHTGSYRGTLIQTVTLQEVQAIGTVTYFMAPLPKCQSSYRLIMEPLTLLVSDRQVVLQGLYAGNFHEIANRTPACSLTHPNCSRMAHWVSFSSRTAGTPPFIKFGYGYQMQANVLFHFASKTQNNHDDTLRQVKIISLGDGIPLYAKPKVEWKAVLYDIAPFIVPLESMSRDEHIIMADRIYMSPDKNPLLKEMLFFIQGLTVWCRGISGHHILPNDRRVYPQSQTEEQTVV